MDVIDAGHAHAGTIVVMVRFSDGGGVFPLFQLS